MKKEVIIMEPDENGVYRPTSKSAKQEDYRSHKKHRRKKKSSDSRLSEEPKRKRKGKRVHKNINTRENSPINKQMATRSNLERKEKGPLGQFIEGFNLGLNIIDELGHYVERKFLIDEEDL